MVDITHKSNTLRSATAQAIVKVSHQATIEAIKEDKVPKGNVFAMSKAAGLLGVKKTADLLPDCHPMPIEFTGIEYEIQGLEILVKMTVKTIYKTGVEVEAMHGASIVALNMYDMLKPIDKGIEIGSIKLLDKKGGKSTYKPPKTDGIKAGIVVCSDRVSKGTAEDRSGKLIKERLQQFDIAAQVVVIPDEVDAIQQQIKELVKERNFVIISGGTGLSPRDVTPEALLPLLDKRITGVEEKIRSYGQDRMPYAMLSRSVVGTIGNSLIMALPGSSKGVGESLDAVLPHLFHIFSILKGEAH
ncbi:bifunctional molybdenum cofactor biosynthesis protein MoaC/MoaB [Flavimarina sp. Hel_I_48]|uniref:bifunctional molybdenum cofactor biosynthesis protein MoaC/MoaB n=1 Tax=Flavimarina sp. Hel_I_48 TaxID=1392488 RepID=UPI0004DF52EC|nr:bifunctional molybdenum cofactor biosynthesis protein MoaC/MoaB [Flavimarina sp. Hel_I_48]